MFASIGVDGVKLASSARHITMPKGRAVTWRQRSAPLLTKLFSKGIGLRAKYAENIAGQRGDQRWTS